MMDLQYYGSKNKLQYESSYINQEDRTSNGIKNVGIMTQEKQIMGRRKYAHSVRNHKQQPSVIFHLSNFGSSKSRKYMTRHASMPELWNGKKRKKHNKLRNRSTDAIPRNKITLNAKYVVSEQCFKYNLNPYNVTNRTNFKVYRCQLSSNVAENCNNCCCSCNSDVLFQVMKDLYDCYKSRDCENCNCILCCHLPEHDRLEPKKSRPSIGLESALKEVAMRGFALPEGKSASEKKLISKIRYDLGLPPEPKNQAMRDQYTNAANAGLMLPLEGKAVNEKQKILQDLANKGIPLPKGRTPSEKSLIAKIEKKAGTSLEQVKSSEKMGKAKSAGQLTPFDGKSPEQMEKTLRGLAKRGLPLPKGKTASQKKLINKVRADLGLPPEPKTSSIRDKHKKAAKAGLLKPLEGKSPSEKLHILRGLHDMGIPLPAGRTSTEEALIAKIQAKPPATSKSETSGAPSPLDRKTPEQKEKILRELAMKGALLPKGKTKSESNLIDKVRAELGLPPEPKTSRMKATYKKAADAGLMHPLEGKLPAEKKKILRGLANMGIPLPKGRTPSEKALIGKIKEEGREPPISPEKLRKAKAAGLITPLEGKPPAQKEEILKGLAMIGIPLPEGKTKSEKNLMRKVRADLGLPPKPSTASMKEKHAKAADAEFLLPLEGKSPAEKEKILRGQADMGIPLPKGRTPSEKALIAKIKEEDRESSMSPEKLRKAKAAGLITPLEGKTPAQKEEILRGLAMLGIPLPEEKTKSEKNLMRKIRADLGLPPEPNTESMKEKHAKAANAGFLLPLEGKTPAEKEKILRGQADMGIPLPKGRTPSEKALIAKIKEREREPSISSKKLRKAKAAGLLTPLDGKTPRQKKEILKGLAMLGVPLPEGKTKSEKNLIRKMRSDLGLPPEPDTASMKAKHAKAANAGFLLPLEGKSPAEKEKILRGQANMGIPLPKGRTPSEKALIAKIKESGREPSISSEKLRKAQAAGLITPLEGKTPAQKEDILRGLAMIGVPLPGGKTKSEKNLISKIRSDLGLPPEPSTTSMKAKHAKAANAGFLLPLEGKSPAEKEKIIRGQADMGIPLPKGRTPSEKALIAKIKESDRGPPISPEKLRKAKAAGLITPLEGKTPAQKEEILRGLAMLGIPLPEGKTKSEKDLILKIRVDSGLPPEPSTASMKAKHAKAADAGFLLPLEGKSPAEKEKILQGQADMGIPLPKGRTPSEKALIAKIKESDRGPPISPEKLRKAKAAGLITPLEGKTPAQKEEILRGLAMLGIPLPEGKTKSEKDLILKIRVDSGLPPEPNTASMKAKHAKAADAGFLLPLEGKSPAEKEKILRGQADMGIPLPKGRTPLEKALIAKIKESGREPSISSEKLRKAKAAGLITPLEGKTPAQKEEILKGLAMLGVPLPEGKTKSEKDLVLKIRLDYGLPPEPNTAPMKAKHAKAANAGFLQPLEGKTPAEKKKILQGLVDMGIPLPDGRTPSEKSLIANFKTQADQKATPSEKETTAKETGVPLTKSAKIRSAKAAGLLTPLHGKSPEQKEKIIRGLAKAGLPIPEPKTASERTLIIKIRNDMGLPPEPSTSSLKLKYEKAHDAGIISPLEGKTPAEKEKILKRLHSAGIPLPKARTRSEKVMLKAIKAGVTKPKTPFEELTPEKKEKLLRNLIKAGKSLPDAKTPSGKDLIIKIRKDMGLPPEPDTESMKKKMRDARTKGILTPLEGKTLAQKKKNLRGLADAKIPLPEGRTPSEKAMIRKIQAESKKERQKQRKEAEETPSEKMLTDKTKDEAAKVSSKKLRDAKAAGLLTPLKGKPPAHKKKIVRGLAEAGLPLPKGETSSEKSLIAKTKAEFGIPATTRSEKDRVHKAKAKLSLSSSFAGKTKAQKERRKPEGMTASEIGKTDSAVATDKIEEVDKEVSSSTCERACGCDKKKIRFKHSYVKIKVSSPDLSSICPCPDECLPGPKKGVFVDDKGINVVVGRATGMTPYPRLHKDAKIGFSIENTLEKIKANSHLCKLSTTSIDNICIKCRLIQGIYVHHNLESGPNSKSLNSIFGHHNSPQYDYKSVKNVSYHEMPLIIQENDRFKSISNNYMIDMTPASSQGSIDSILIIKSETTISFSSSCEDCSTNIIFGAITSSTTSFYHISSGLDLNYETVEPLELSTDGINYCMADMIARCGNNLINESTLTDNTEENNVFHVFQMSEKKLSNDKKTKNGQPVLVINQLNSEFDVTTVVDEILSKKEFCDASSLFVVVPTSDDAISSGGSNSATCIQLSENHHKWKYLNDGDQYMTRRRTSKSRGLRVSTKGKRFFLDGVPTISACNHNKVCQATTTDTNAQRGHVVSTDTTQDRPCCCPQKSSISSIQGRRGFMHEQKTVSICQIHPCGGRQSCHTPPGVQNPNAPPMDHPLVELKKLLNKPDSCLKDIQLLIHQIQSGMVWIPTNTKNSCCSQTKGSAYKMQQHQVLAVNHSNMSCLIQPCSGRSSCHSPEDVLRFPNAVPLQPPLMELKQLLNNPDSCPERRRELYEQIQAGKVKMPANTCGGQSKGRNMPQQHELLSENQSEMSCRIQPCSGRQSCHSPEDVLRFPHAVPLQPPLMELKQLLNNPDSCPERRRELYEQIQAGKLKRRSNKHKCCPPPPTCPPPPPTCPSRPAQSPPAHQCPSKTQQHEVLSENQSEMSCRIQPCSGRQSCHSPEDVLRFPHAVPLQPPLMELKQLLNNPDSCPERRRELYEQIQAGRLKRRSNKHKCCPPPPTCPPPPPTCPSRPAQSTPAHQCPSKTQQHEASYENQSEMSCLIQPCSGRQSCHSPEDVLRFPHAVPLQPPLMELKELLNNPDSCPERRRELYEQIQAGRLKRRSNKHKCCPPPPTCPPPPPTCPSRPAQSTPAHQCRSKTQQHDVLSENQSVMSCLIQPCSGRSSCHSPEDVLRFPHAVPLQPPLMELKQLLNNPDSCPERRRELYEQIQAGKLKRRSNKHTCHAPPPTCPPPPPCPAPVQSSPAHKCRSKTQQQGLTENQSEMSCLIQPCSGRSSCHSPEDVLRFPHAVPLQPPLMELKQLLNNPDSCPERRRELYEQIQAGKLKRRSNKHTCHAPTPTCPPPPPTCPPPPPCPAPVQSPPAHKCHHKKERKKPPCSGKKSSPEDVFRYPYSTPLQQSLMELKQLLNQPNSCPDKIKDLCKQIQAESMKKRRMKNICSASSPTCVAPVRSIPSIPISQRRSKTQQHKCVPENQSVSSCQIPPRTRRSACHSPQEVRRCLTPQQRSLMELEKLLNDPSACPDRIRELCQQIRGEKVKRQSNKRICCNPPPTCPAPPPTCPAPPPTCPAPPPTCPAPPPTCPVRPTQSPPAHKCPSKTQKHKCVPENQPNSSCHIPPRTKKSACHSQEVVLQCPNSAPLQQSLMELKKLLNDPYACPDRIKELCKQIHGDKVRRRSKKHTCCNPPPTCPAPPPTCPAPPPTCPVHPPTCPAPPPTCPVHPPTCPALPPTCPVHPPTCPAPVRPTQSPSAHQCPSKPQKHKCVQENQPSSSCHIPPCIKKSTCPSPPPVPRCPVTPLSPPLMELRNLLDQPNPCPERIKELCEQILGGKVKKRSKKHICQPPPPPCPAPVRPIQSLPTQQCPSKPQKNKCVPENQPSSSCHIPPCIKKSTCPSPPPVPRCPVTPLSPPLMELKNLLNQPNPCPEKIKELCEQILGGKMKKRSKKHICQPPPPPCPAPVRPIQSLPTQKCPSKTQKHKCMPGIPSKSSCQIPPGSRKSVCHSPEDVLRYPNCTPLPQPLMELKKLLNEPNACPDKIQELFEQIQAGYVKKRSNMKKVCVPPSPTCSTRDSPIHTSAATECLIETQQENTTKSLCQISPCSGMSECFVVVFQCPNSTPLSPPLMELKNLLDDPNTCPERIQEFFDEMQAEEARKRSNKKRVSLNTTPTCSAPATQIQPPPAIKCLNKTHQANRTKPLCQIPPCSVESGCDSPEIVPRCPISTSLSQPLMELKDLLDDPYLLDDPDTCPERILELFEQIQAGEVRKRSNKKRVSLNTTPTCSAPATQIQPRPAPKCLIKTQQGNRTKPLCQIPPCSGESECDSPEDVARCPNSIPLSQPLMELKDLLDDPYLLDDPDTCPERILELFEQIQAGEVRKRSNKKRVSLNTTPTCSAPATQIQPRPAPKCLIKTQQANTTRSLCQIPPCSGESESDSLEEVPRCPNNTPFSPPLMELKDFLDDPNTCPERIQELFEHMETSKVRKRSNMKRVSLNTSPTCSAPATQIQPPPAPKCPSKTQKHKCVPEKTTKSLCEIPPCSGMSKCDSPEDVPRCPNSIPLSESLMELKKLLNQPNTCPRKILEFFEKTQAGNVKKKKKVCLIPSPTCEAPVSPIQSPPASECPGLNKILQLNSSDSSCMVPPCSGKTDDFRYPNATPLPYALKELKKLLNQPNISPEKIQELFEQIQSGNMRKRPNVKNICWAPMTDTPARACPIPTGPVNLPPSCQRKAQKQIHPPVHETSSTCQIPSCSGKKGCHSPEDLLLYPHGTPLSQPLMELRKLLNKPDTSPVLVRELFELIQAANMCDDSDMSSILANTAEPPCPMSVCLPTPLNPCQLPSASPNDIICTTCFKPKYKDGKKMQCACSGKKKTVKIKPLCPCEQHKEPIARTEIGLKKGTRSLGCQCCICDELSATTSCGEAIRLGQTAPTCAGPPVCIGTQDGPGGLKWPSMLPPLRRGKIPSGKRYVIPKGQYGQPNQQREMVRVQVIGPVGGYAVESPEGKFTQAGTEQIRYSTGQGSGGDTNNLGAEPSTTQRQNCECKGAQKKGNVECECPPSPPPPEPPPAPEPDSELPQVYLIDLEDYENFMGYKTLKRSKEDALMKSNLTQTTSGFKFNKKKKPPPPPPPQEETDLSDEWSIEDTVRYFVQSNPEAFRDLIPPIAEPCSCENLGRKRRRKSKKNECICPSTTPAPTPAPAPASAPASALPPGLRFPPTLTPKVIMEAPPETSQEEATEEDEGPFTGFKIMMSGKGSASKGLSGICCFDMMEER